MEGWIKLYRKFEKWEWYNDSKTVHLFIHLLIHANHSDNKWQGNMIKRGQLITGRDKIKAATGITTQSIRTSLSRLKSTNEITIKVTNKFSLITILNYDLYQDIEKTNQPANQQLTNKQPTTNQQLTTNKNDKKEKNLKNDKNTIPPTLEMITFYSQSRDSNIDVNKFFNFYEAKNWMIGKNKMKDWQAAYRTWEPSKIKQKVNAW